MLQILCYLFNDDTYPQIHYSRLPQVGFSQLFILCKHITEYSGVVKVWRLIKVPNSVSWWVIKIMGCTGYMIFHIRWRNPASLRNSTMQASGIVSKRVLNESALYHSSRISCYTVHSRSMCSVARVWPLFWQAVGGPRDQFEAWVLQPPQLLSGAGISWVGGPSVGVNHV